MNIKIITRHGPSNYGSLLQSIATIKILELLGHSSKIINYQRKDERGLKMVFTQVLLKEEYGNFLKKLAYIVVRYPIEKLAQVKFDRMRSHYLKMTEQLTTHHQLLKLKADAFMTGSDQVWGPTMNGKFDSAYFLQFTSNDSKRLAYAASFGKVKFDTETISTYKQMLQSYNKITVREESAAKMIESWGEKNCMGQVLDPTLLLNGKEWVTLMIPLSLQKKYDKMRYILVYQIHNDPKLSSFASRLAKYSNLPIFRVSPFLHQALRGGKFIYCPDVSEFLALINNAKYIVTDSFHGTCFALNFNKQFFEVLPKNETGTRNQSILALTGLSNRIITDFNNKSIIDKNIDYISVNKILEKERKRSMVIMKELLK